MALTINWSEGAIADFEQITEFLNKHWSEKGAIEFVLKTEFLNLWLGLHPGHFCICKPHTLSSFGTS